MPDRLQAEWLPELKKAVEEINKNFGHSFERIGCAGEVQLYEEEDPETGLLDFDKFAMHIKVRFRAEEELQLLTAHRQSGGERSVATILYLIAIQVQSHIGVAAATAVKQLPGLIGIITSRV